MNFVFQKYDPFIFARLVVFGGTLHTVKFHCLIDSFDADTHTDPQTC